MPNCYLFNTPDRLKCAANCGFIILSIKVNRLDDLLTSAALHGEPPACVGFPSASLNVVFEGALSARASLNDVAK